MTQEEKNELWERHRPYIEVLSQVNNSYVLVNEWGVGPLYISSNYDTCFDYLPDFKTKDLISKKELIDASIHPDDWPIVMNLRKRGFEFIAGLPFEQRKDYKHVLEFRVLGPGKNYMRLLLQYHLLEITESNDYILLLGISDLSPDQSLDEPVKFRLINFKTSEVINFSVFEKTDMPLTKRELEILKLVNEGMLSKEISNQLSISIHTVNRHRQNIMEKMNVDNVMEAINYSRKLGLIG